QHRREDDADRAGLRHGRRAGGGREAQARADPHRARGARGTGVRPAVAARDDVAGGAAADGNAVNAQAPKSASHGIVMRHANTVEDFAGRDFDRPLSPQGRAAAREAALAMHSAGHHPGPLLVSAALSARQTAAIIATELHIPDDDIQVSDELYAAPPEVLE